MLRTTNIKAHKKTGRESILQMSDGESFIVGEPRGEKALFSMVLGRAEGPLRVVEEEERSKQEKVM